MKMMQSALKGSWGTDGWKTQQLKLLKKLNYIDDSVNKRIRSMVYSDSNDMRIIGLKILDALWEKHVNNIIKNNKNEDIKLLRLSS